MIGSELISASDMLVRNIPTLQGQTLCEYLQKMDNEENEIKIKEENEIQKRNSFSIKVGLISGVFYKIISLYCYYREYRNSQCIDGPLSRVYRGEDPKSFGYYESRNYPVISMEDFTLGKFGFASISSIIVGVLAFLCSRKFYEENMTKEVIWDKKKIIAIRSDRIEVKIRNISERMTNLSLDRQNNSKEIEQLQRVKDFF